MALDRTALGAFDFGVLPSATPEDAFLAWVLWLPADADIAERALVEISRIDGGGAMDDRRRQLRALLASAAEAANRS